MGKRKYTRSAKSDAQRRGAAFKHGQYAESALRQTHPPCKKTTCPIEEESKKGRCSLKLQADALERPLQVCAFRSAQMDDATREKYLRALEKGDLSGTQEIAATVLARMADMAVTESDRLALEGLAVEYQIYGKEGDCLGSGTKVNPRVDPLLRIIETVGFTASQQAITPKSAGEKKRDDGIGATLDFYSRRAALAAGPAQIPAKAG